MFLRKMTASYPRPIFASPEPRIHLSPSQTFSHFRASAQVLVLQELSSGTQRCTDLPFTQIQVSRTGIVISETQSASTIDPLCFIVNFDTIFHAESNNRANTASVYSSCERTQFRLQFIEADVSCTFIHLLGFLCSKSTVVDDEICSWSSLPSAIVSADSPVLALLQQRAASWNPDLAALSPPTYSRATSHVLSRRMQPFCLPTSPHHNPLNAIPDDVVNVATIPPVERTPPKKLPPVRRKGAVASPKKSEAPSEPSKPNQESPKKKNASPGKKKLPPKRPMSGEGLAPASPPTSGNTSPTKKAPPKKVTSPPEAQAHEPAAPRPKAPAKLPGKKKAPPKK